MYRNYISKRHRSAYRWIDWTAPPKTPEEEEHERREDERREIGRILEIANVTLEGESDLSANSSEIGSNGSNGTSPESSPDSESDSDGENCRVLHLFSSKDWRPTESRILHITNLVPRCYSTIQLKRQLSTTGTFSEERFWINPIGTHCYVVYDTVEAARRTRQELHKTRWPKNSPKVLLVNYATEKDLNRLLRPINKFRWPEPRRVEMRRYRREEAIRY